MKTMPFSLQRLLLAWVVLATWSLGSAPAFAQAQTDAKPAPALARPADVDATTYRIGAEDLLEISVWREDTLRKEVLVRPDGGISYPLIGDVRAAGRTVPEIREEITQRLEKYIPDAVVSVTILRTGSQRVYVLGKVARPGEFPVGRNVDVLQALSMAGGLTQFADANGIRIMRREGNRQVMLPFEYGRIVRGENLEQNVMLRAGDVVVVP